MIQKPPFAVIVTTSDTDLMGAVTLAAPMRQAGAVVETPLAQSQPKRQLRRAYGADAKYIVVLDGASVEVITVADGSRRASSAAAAAIVLASWYRSETVEMRRMEGSVLYTPPLALPMAA